MVYFLDDIMSGFCFSISGVGGMVIKDFSFNKIFLVFSSDVGKEYEIWINIMLLPQKSQDPFCSKN